VKAAVLPHAAAVSPKEASQLKTLFIALTSSIFRMY
jgi:hypothetical protein